jgi:hypothetical protein
VNQDVRQGRPGVADAVQVEETCYRYMKIGGGLVLGGLALMFTSVLFWLGAPVAAFGAVMIAGTILWLLRLNQKAGISVTCPHCDKQYNVLPGFHSFVCDDCEHVVPVPRAAA